MKGAVRKPGYQSPSILSPSSSPPSDSSKEQERYLPIANVSRIMKRSLPSNAKISKEAKETVQECVSEFISFITGEASDKCQREKRKTINGDDLLWAMTTLGFDPYVAPLKTFLNRYRESEGEKNAVARLQETAEIVPPSLSEEGTAVGFDPGFYSPAQGFGGGGNGLFGKMDGGRGPPLQGQVYGFRW